MVESEAAKISLSDNIRLQLFVSIPAFFRGLITARRTLAWLLLRPTSGIRGTRLLTALRQKYRSDHLWAWFPFRRTLLVQSQPSMEYVLSSTQNQADPTIKRCPFAQFVPAAVIVSSGDAWEDRRKFNEAVLGFGHDLHPQAEAFMRIVSREVGHLTQPLAAEGRVLRWEDFQDVATRISQQVVVGSGQVDLAWARQMTRMAKLSNWSLRSFGFSAFYGELERYLASHRTPPRRADAAQDGSAPASCLMHASAAMLDSGAATSTTQVPSQIGFWLFVLKDALELFVARTLALLAAHPRVQEQVRREIVEAGVLNMDAIHGLKYLEACLSEQLRLWTPVPILLRRARTSLTLRDGISVGQGEQILLNAGFYHRSPEVFGDRTDRFMPDAWDAAIPMYFFSAHRQSCAGQYLARFLLKATLASYLSACRFELIAPQIDVTRVSYFYNHFRLRLRAVPTR